MEAEVSLPRMSLHIGDYKKDTGHLRAAGHGAYFLLMMHYWATGGIPDDDRQLAAIACMTDKEWKQWGPIVKAFFKEDGLRHKRIDKEYADAIAKYERRAAAGKKGGEAKAEGKQSSSNATAGPQQPITNNPKEEEERTPSLRSGGTRKRGTRLPDDFQLSEAEIEFAASHGLAGDPLQAVFQDFCDYWHARAGPQGVKLDWAATWRRWVRTESDKQKNRGHRNGRSDEKSVHAAVDRLAENLRALDRPAPAELRDGAGEGAVRRISSG